MRITNVGRQALTTRDNEQQFAQKNACRSSVYADRSTYRDNARPDGKAEGVAAQVELQLHRDTLQQNRQVGAESQPHGAAWAVENADNQDNGHG
jgi:hypothetical protein